MRIRHAAVVAGLALGFVSGTAKAAFVFSVDQSGGNVIATGQGSINLSGLTNEGSVGYGEAIAPVYGYLQVGAGDEIAFENIIGPRNFGLGVETYSDLETGLPFAILANSDDGTPQIIVSSSYVSGSKYFSTSTFFNTSFSKLGLIEGSYVFKLPDDTVTVNIGNVSTVSLPASAPMFGAALLALGAFGYGVKRKGKAAA